MNDRHNRLLPALPLTDERLHALLLASSEVIYQAKPDWSKLHYFVGGGFNPDATESLEASLEKYIPPEDHATVMTAIQEAIQSKAPYELEHRVLRPNGDRGWAVSRAVPLLDRSGEIAEWFGATSGITKRKATENALLQAKQELEQAHRQKDQFLAALSHELRNPLAPVMNSLHILNRVEPDSEKSERAKRVIDRQINHLSNLVDDLVDVSRLTRNKVELRKERVDLGEVVQAAVEDYESLFHRVGARVELEPLSEPLAIVADRTRLTQIVGNLVQNAAKYSNKGDRTRVSITAEEDVAVLRVADSGVGMTPETLKRLFEPFSQAKQAIDRKEGGLGLGLAMVKGLVELHGGAVSADSRGLGHGSLVTVRLPLHTEPVPAPDVKQQQTSGGKRILVIEDNVDAADSLCELLELDDWAVTVTYNGEDGLKKAREFRPEVIFCDIGLPKMDGYEVARAFRADDQLKGTYLVALSGYAQPDDRRRSSEAGFDRHLAKPPKIEALKEILDDLT